MFFLIYTYLLFACSFNYYFLHSQTQENSQIQGPWGSLSGSLAYAACPLPTSVSPISGLPETSEIFSHPTPVTQVAAAAAQELSSRFSFYRAL